MDNILVKLAGEGVPFVRLGREQTVHPAVRPFVPGGERHPANTVAALKELGQTIPVVSLADCGRGLPQEGWRLAGWPALPGWLGIWGPS